MSWRPPPLPRSGSSDWDGSRSLLRTPALVDADDGFGNLLHRRRCSSCHVFMPEDRYHFPARTRNAKGELLRFHCECFACCRAKSKATRARNAEEVRKRDRARYERRKNDPEWMAARREENTANARRSRAMNPEKARETQRRHRERVAADPARRERYLERRRLEYRLRQRRLGRAPGPSRLGGSISHSVTLPSWPVVEAMDRAIVRARAEYFNEKDPASEGPTKRVCRVCDVSERRLYSWRSGEYENLEWPTADRVLTALGLFWWEVWKPAELAKTHPEAARFLGVDVELELARARAEEAEAA